MTAEPSEPYVLGDLTIDYAQRRVTVAGRHVRLTLTEYGMLAELSAHAGPVPTHEHLLERVWRERGDGSVRHVNTMVSKLRRKLGDYAGGPTYIFTEPRVGFRLPKGKGRRRRKRKVVIGMSRAVIPMCEVSRNEGKQDVPLGSDSLRLVRDQERRCEDTLNEWLPSAGVTVPQTMDRLGTSLSYLDRIASCWWGCRQDTHVEERLVGRVASNARAALQLMRSGYYDEAFGLVRQIGEMANLLSLFMQSEESYKQWKGASEDVVRNDFSPGMVRKKLEELPLPLPMDRETYGLLSTQSTHVSPDTSPQSHNPFGLPTLGGYFQEAGALLALNHLGGMVGWMLWLAVALAKPPTDRKVIVDASVSLLRSIGGINLNSIPERFDEIRGSSQFRMETESLRRWQQRRQVEPMD